MSKRPLLGLFLSWSMLTSAIAGCIETPSGTVQQSGQAITFRGVTTRPDQEITFTWLDRRMAAPGTPPVEAEITRPFFLCDGQPCLRFDPLTVRSSTVPRAGSRGRLFDWTVSIPTFARFSRSLPLTFFASAWMPQDPAARALPTGPGRVELAAYPVVDGVRATLPLPSSTDGAFGNGRTFVEFDNDGVGLVADPVVAWSGARIRVPTRDVEVEYGSYGVRRTIEDPPEPVLAIMCHPIPPGATTADQTPMRTIILNHGGAWDGVTAQFRYGITGRDLDFCVQMATRGWRVAMSAYRGLGVTHDGALDGGARVPIEIDHAPAPNLALAEFCLGEVVDVLRWTEVVRARPDVRADRILMIGGSHGAGITLRAVEQGAPVTAAVALAPLTDFNAIYAAGVAANPRGYPAVAAQFFGGPSSGPPPPGALEARSAVRMAVDITRRANVRLLVAAQLGDSVVSPDQSCLLASLVGTSNHFLDPSGGIAPPPALPPASVCIAVPRTTWNPASPMALGWPAQRYFLLYDAPAGSPGGVAIHVGASFFEPWRMSMDSVVASFIASIFDP